MTSLGQDASWKSWLCWATHAANRVNFQALFGLVFLHVLDDDRGGVRMCSVLSVLLVVSFRVGRVVFLPSALNCQRGFAICKKGQVFFLCCFAQETVKKKSM